MKSKFMKMSCFLSAVCLIVCALSSCKKDTAEVKGGNVDNTVATSSSDTEKSTEKDSEEKTTKEGETTSKEKETTKEEENKTSAEKGDKTTKNSKTSFSDKKITLTSGLNSSDVSEVLSYYKLVANKNAKVKMKKDLSLAYLDVGTLIIDGESDSPNRAKGLSAFEKGADFALGFAGGNTTFPGNPSAIRVSDWTSAKAVNDGTYTTLTINVKSQTDGYNGKEYEGSVGRSMQVLAGFDTAITTLNKFPGITMTADFAHSDVKIVYENPTIKIKVKNSTGELQKESCKWSYRTKIYLNFLDATMKVMQNHTVTIKNSGGAVDYSVRY